MKNRAKLVWAFMMMLAFFPLKSWAQEPFRQYADDGILVNFHQIDNVDFRVFLIYNLSQDDRFTLIADEEPGLFSISSSPESGIENLHDAFEEFYQNTYADFSLLSKMDIYDFLPEWKDAINPAYFTSITLDIALRKSRTDNDHCANSDPFCTTNQYSFDAAATSQTADQLEGVTIEDGCIGSSYNPSWYHMRIRDAGQFIIHMEGRDPSTGTTRDIDFCIWGPFTDPYSPCVAGLTTSNIIDCCYSADPTEDIYLGYAEGSHTHTTSHGTVNYHLPQTGEYYILMITNFSQQPCTITFSKTVGSGPGTTDCDILPGIANNDGPYCVGETINLSVNSQPGASYHWTGPSNYSSNTQNPTINNCTLDMAGTYTCVTTVGGESASGTTTVVVYAQPTADFETNLVCEGTATQFTSTSTTNPTGENIASYQWSFGDGGTSTETNPTHTYAAAGTYQATLTVSNGNGLCTDEITKTVIVSAVPAPTATANPTSVEYAGVSTITGNAGVEGSFSYHWEPADMVTDPNSQTTQTVPLTETQVYTLTVTNNEGGCTSTTTVTVIMDGSNLTATATADQYELCEGASTTIHAIPHNGTGNYTFTWNPDETLSSTTAQNPTVTPLVGSTTYTCVVSDGIIDQTVSVTIVVHPNMESDIFYTICENDTYQFFDQSLHIPGIYDHTIQTHFGCDSTIHLHLDNWQIYETELTDSFCEGDTYNFYGQVINSAGIYTHTLPTINGCDSVLRLDLTRNPIEYSEFTVPEEEACDQYFWDPQGHIITYTDHDGDYYTSSGHYHRTYLNELGCDSLVTMTVRLEYTPNPTEIMPMDPTNIAPHWVVTASEFQINTYDFMFWDHNPICHWDSIVWQIDTPNLSWLIEPDSTTHPAGKNCKLYVLEHVDDTIWFHATVYNRCAPEGRTQRYWVVCSFYGVDETIGNQADFSVVPNPNNGQMTLNFEYLTGKVNVKVYDMRGALIDNFETYNGSEMSSMTYDMSNRADGIYHFVATGKEGTIAKKVVIQR